MKPLKEISKKTNRDILELADIVASACEKLDCNSISAAVATYSGRAFTSVLEEMHAASEEDKQAATTNGFGPGKRFLKIG